MEKILEDALLKISVVISDLFGVSGCGLSGALVAGERSPKALAALGRGRLKARHEDLELALNGQFDDPHAEVIRSSCEIDFLGKQAARAEMLVSEQLALIPESWGAWPRRRHRPRRQRRPGRGGALRGGPAG